VDKYQLQTNFAVEARGTGKDNAKKKRMRRFFETEQKSQDESIKEPQTQN